MANITETIASYIANTKYADLPSDVVQKAKRCILDSIGCMLGGYVSDAGSRFAALASSLSGRADATIVGDGSRVAFPNAAMANAYMANILDFDDTYIGHPGCTVIPCALGGGELRHASGEELITAAVVGYEVHSRIGASLYYSPETNAKIRGVMYQTFGAVAAASKILSLTYDQILDALGIAATTSPVQSNAKTSGEENVPPTLKIGFYACAMVGSLSGLMARSGFTGPNNVFDGDTGYWRMAGADHCDFNKMTDDLGNSFEIRKVAFKPYSCCRWFHSSLDALLSIVRENGLTMDDITSVRIATTAGKSKTGYLTNQRPANIVAAVFSLPYSASVALTGLEPGPDWLSESMMRNEKIMEFAKRVECKFTEKTEKEQAADIHRWPARVEVVARTGRFVKDTEHPRGSPKNPLSDSELDEKFLSMAKPVLGEPQAVELKRIVESLETAKDVRELTSLLHSKDNRPELLVEEKSR